MNRPYSLNPLKRFNRNRQRVKRRLLPSELPSPFYHAHDINAVLDYFSGVAQERPQVGPDMLRGMRGCCYLCDEKVLFRIDVPADGSPVNWRETLVCPHCKLINRWRSCLHVFEAICKPDVDDRIYLTETLSPIFQNLAGRFPLLSASEYFPDHEFGDMVQTHSMLVRNEDVTRLSFADSSQDIILCFDVLEHVPDFRTALREFHRVLDTGGQLVISVPFSFQRETIVRARLDSAGNIEHLTEPCYHGDPLSDQGVLSYYDFGMDLLDEMREAGFQECFLTCCYSKEWAYLNRNLVYVARKLKSGTGMGSLVQLAWEVGRIKTGLIGERLAARVRRRMLSMQSPHVNPSHPHFPARGKETQGGGEINAEITELPGLPEIFHYWSNKFLAKEMTRFGFTNPQDFFFQYTKQYLKKSNKQQVKVLSIGSGDCAFEIGLVQKLLQWQIRNFVFECLDYDQENLQKGKEATERAGLSEFFLFTCEDLNGWRPYRKYGLVLASHSFSSVWNLEGVFDSVKRSLKKGGLFIIAEFIGRNGRTCWPESLQALKPFWDELPESYRYNRILNRQETRFIDHDASREGFEALRTQDVLPLLMERFDFRFFFPYGSMTFVFIDRMFGHNFDAGADWDRDFVDRVHLGDEEGLRSGELKPTSMLAVLTNVQTEMVLRYPVLTPGHCVRKDS